MFLSDDEFNDALPSLDEVNKAINDFKKLNWTQLSLTAIPKIVNKAILNAVFLHGPSPTIENLFRVRPFNSFNGEVNLSKKSSFSYPPVEFCSLNRCNIPGKQVFYGSLSIYTALNETLSPDENLYFISKWKTINLEEVNGVHLLGNSTYEYFAKMKSLLFEKFTDNKENLPVLERIQEFYEEVFSTQLSNKNWYKFTAHIANKILHEYPLEMGFIAYTSVKRDNGAINYVLRKDIADSYLELDKVYLCQINEHNPTDNMYSYSFPKYGIYNNEYEKLKWKTMDQEEYKLVEKLLGVKND